MRWPAGGVNIARPLVTIGSFLRLGYYFVKRLLLRLFRKKTGLQQFHENYSGDRLLPLAPGDHEALALFSGCIACGMCDAQFSAYGRAARRDFHGPSDLPLSYSRGLPDYDALGSYVTSLRRGDLELLERVCPARIPFGQLATFVENVATALQNEPLPPELSTRKRHDPG